VGTPASTPVCYFLDEHLSPDVASYLRRHGIDVLTALEAGRANRRVSDAEQLDYASNEGRVLVWRDADFLNPDKLPQLLTGNYAGILALRRLVGIGQQSRFLRYIAATETMESLAGRIRHFEPIPPDLFVDG
jgi:predicted nuclease of predicted toxin-antitoxin system